MKGTFQFGVWVFFLTVIPWPSTFAQVRGICGITAEEQHMLYQQIDQFKQPTVEPRETYYIPIVFHPVARTNGTGAYTRYDRMLNAICMLNEDFSAQGMVFYLPGVTESIRFDVKNNLAFDNPRQNYGASVMKLKADETKYGVNIFIVNRISYDPAQQTLGYFSPSYDYVVMLKKEISSPSSTFAHELGHFFGLLHTFYGWEETQYNPNLPTPTEVTLQTANITVPVEYVSRDKMRNNQRICEIAADKLCDTEANYKLGFGYFKCEWKGIAKDPDNVPLRPQERNYMSYFLHCDDYFFTAEQGQVMRNNYLSPSRNYLRKRKPSVVDAPDGDVTPIYPPDKEELEVYGPLTIDWEDIPHATHYLIEVSRRRSFSTVIAREIVDQSEFSLEFSPNKYYYWRVKPINETHLCEPFSSTFRFKTGTVYVRTNDIEDIDRWWIHAYPEARITIHSMKPWHGQLVIFDANGQTVHRQSVQIPSGQSTIAIPHKLPPGVYYVKIEDARRFEVKRWLVLP